MTKLTHLHQLARHGVARASQPGTSGESDEDGAERDEYGAERDASNGAWSEPWRDASFICQGIPLFV